MVIPALGETALLAQSLVAVSASTVGRLAGERFVISRAREGTNGFNMHPYLAHFGGKFWAIWSSNRVRDLQGQLETWRRSQGEQP